MKMRILHFTDENSKRVDKGLKPEPPVFTLQEGEATFETEEMDVEVEVDEGWVTLYGGESGFYLVLDSEVVEKIKKLTSASTSTSKE